MTDRDRSKGMYTNVHARAKGLGLFMSEVSLQEAVAMGFGSRSTLLRRINDGTLHPKRGSKRRYIFDLSELREKLDPTPFGDAEYIKLVRSIVDAAPKLTREQAASLVRYLDGEVQ